MLESKALSRDYRSYSYLADIRWRIEIFKSVKYFMVDSMQFNKCLLDPEYVHGFVLGIIKEHENDTNEKLTFRDFNVKGKYCKSQQLVAVCCECYNRSKENSDRPLLWGGASAVRNKQISFNGSIRKS